MDFPYELICHRYVLNSFYFSKILNNEYADLTTNPFNWTAMCQTIDEFDGRKHGFFPDNFYKSTFMGKTMIDEYRILALQMIIMDFINFICIYGSEIVIPVFRGTDRGLIFDKAVGERIHNQNLVSTSVNLDIAKSFGDKVIIIRPTGNKGIVITKPLVSSTGVTMDEQEVIFPPCMSTKIRENFQQDKLYTEITFQNSPPPVIHQSRYKEWFRGDETAWDYYKKHSYFATLYAEATAAEAAHERASAAASGRASVNGGSVNKRKSKRTNKKRKTKNQNKKNKV